MAEFDCPVATIKKLVHSKWILRSCQSHKLTADTTDRTLKIMEREERVMCVEPWPNGYHSGR